MDVQLNNEFFSSLEKGWKVPVGVSESEQVASVMEQMRAIGLEPNQAGVLAHVREVNRAYAQGKLNQ